MKRTKTPKNQVEHTDNFDKKSHIEKAGMKLTDYSYIKNRSLWR